MLTRDKNLVKSVLFARWQLVSKVWNDDPVHLTLDLLNPKSTGFDKVLITTTLASFKSFRSGVSFYRANIVHTQTPTLIHTHTSRRRDRNIGAAVLRTSSAPIILGVGTRSVMTMTADRQNNYWEWCENTDQASARQCSEVGQWPATHREHGHLDVAVTCPSHVH